MKLKGILVSALSFGININANAYDGLSGRYWNPQKDTTNIFDFSTTISYVESNPVSDGSFLATNINYNGYDTTKISDFIGNDSISFNGLNGDMSDGIIQLTGYISLTASNSTISIHHDDGFKIIVGDKSISYSCCGYDYLDLTGFNAGWYSIYVLYSA